jgi:serine/threonine protein kinase
MNSVPPTVAMLEIPGCTLVQPIGRGGYGEVWLARTADGAWRAVKIVRREAFESRRQFEREFSGLLQYAKISRGHHALIDVLDVGRDDDGEFFYGVMELADSDNAAWGTGNAEWKMQDADSSRSPIAHSDVTTPHSALLDPHSYVPRTLRSELARGGAPPMSELLPVAIALTSGMGHLHRHGLRHRGIRLDNILLVQGLSKLAEAGLATGQASACSFAGMEGYLPPEGPGAPATDLFELGKVFYELLTGGERRDFPKIPADHEAGPDHAARLEFNEIILRACAPRVEDRYQSADELLADLALLQSGGSVIHTRALGRRLAAAKKAALSGAAIILVLGAAWAVTGSEARRARRAEQAAAANFATARLAQARAERVSHRIGHRVESLRAIAEAATISPNFEWRTEAAGGLALTDLR